MRPTPAGVEVARALIARVKAADSSINRRDELWYASDSDALDRRAWHVRRIAPTDSLRMGNGPVTEWVARLEKPEQAYTAAVLRDDALRVVLEWLRSELPWCLTWAPVLGSLHRWQQVWTPNRLRRYEGAAHAERCSRTTGAAPPSYPDGELSTWAFTWLACITWLLCLWRRVDGDGSPDIGCAHVRHCTHCLSYCLRRDAHGKQFCGFGFPPIAQEANAPHFYFELVQNKDGSAKNTTNAVVAASQRANVDFKPLIDHLSALEYATKYATKQEKGSKMVALALNGGKRAGDARHLGKCCVYLSI